MSTAPQDFTSFGEPVWELATMYPPQGAWSVEEYLELTDSTNRLIEYTDGRIEVLEMPTIAHQRILSYLFILFHKFVSERQLGEVLFAGLRVQLDPTKFREPDIVFLAKGHVADVQGRYWDGADLVVEVVSDDANSRQRDLVRKRAEYAAAGIAEYWIVDPQEKRITVLALEGERYEALGEYTPGQHSESQVLAGFKIGVADVFSAAEG